MSVPFWIKLTIETTPGGLDIMAALLIEHGAGGVQVEPAAVSAYFPAGASWPERLRGIARAIADLPPGSILGSRRVTTEEVPDTDWTHCWREHFRPLRVGARLVVSPSWIDYPQLPGDVVVRLDPAGAFGSGEHPTTAMALTMLEQVVTPGARVVDVGTGSGILALAAAGLGAARVWALDIDETAVSCARENVRVNRLDAVISVKEGTLSGLDEGPVDVIVANIVAHVLVQLVPEVTGRLRPGGTLVAGGIIRQREGDVLRALSAAGLVVTDRQVRGEWVGIAAIVSKRQTQVAEAPPEEPGPGGSPEGNPGREER